MAEKMRINILGDDAKSIELYGKKFNNSQTNILFGLTNQINPAFLTASKLREYLNLSHTALEGIYGQSATNIINDTFNKTNYPNTLFSQFLAFPNVQKVLSLKNISPQESDMIVREWSFKSKNHNTPWCHNMSFDFNGRVRNYYNDNEYYWEIIDGNFNLISKDRKIFTVFDKKEVVNNKLLLTGKFNNQDHSIHYLEEK